MKILYVTDPGLDYLADQIYTGLCKLLGWEQVIDYPFKAVYHDPSSEVCYLPQNAGRRYGQDEILTLLGERNIDLVILSSPRVRAVEALASVSKQSPLPPLVLLDGEDDTRVRRDLFRRFGFGLHFKREYQYQWHAQAGLKGTLHRWREFGSDQDLFRRTYPLPFSIILETVPTAEGGPKDVDISYAGRISNRKRIRAVNVLKNTADIRFEGGVYAEPTDRKSKFAADRLSSMVAKLSGDSYVAENERGAKLPRIDYFRLLHRSKMALSIRGGGFDTLRYWEIVASKTLLVSERPDICIPHNFEHQRHALFCHPDLRDLPSLVHAYAQNDRAREAMVAAAYDHLLKFHTCERRAEQFLDICQKAL